MDSTTFPRAVGRKFHPGGQIRTFPGNSIVCHVATVASLIERLDRLYERLCLARAAASYTLLPPSSWHMTVFNGVCDQERDAGLWPADLARNLPQAEIDREFEARLKAERFGPELTFAMRVKCFRPPRSGISIDLEPANAKEEQAIRALRVRLSETLCFSCPAPDTYTFHITLAYFTKHPSHAEKAELENILTGAVEEMTKSLAPFDVGPPEFCQFNDMFAFSRRFYLV
jgi:hypothetical protein